MLNRNQDIQPHSLYCCLNQQALTCKLFTFKDFFLFALFLNPHQFFPELRDQTPELKPIKLEAVEFTKIAAKLSFD
jgi:hypothetical protein